MPYRDWLKAYSRCLDGAMAACPACGGEGVQVSYFGDAATRLGWAAVWCPTCLGAVQVSRLMVPDGATLLPLDAPMAKELQSLRWLTK
jgi:hypothetical protein